MNAKRLWTLSTLAFVSGLAACTVHTGEDAIADDESKEVWDNANNPAFVDSTFVYEADRLPVAGKAKQTPIPADYWATFRDSVNVRWDGADSLSAAEKYEKAFSKPGTALAVSSNYGIRAQTSRKECAQESDCSAMTDGSSCAIPRGETKGRCIPTWWGICHGWSPYALSEPAAKKPVTKNGVTFYPGDLEGLMSLVYSENLPTKFISQRCNEEHPTTDPDGRPLQGECRDMNAGTMHVVVTNFLGMRGTGIVEDRTWNDQVWNQPIQGYEITNAVGGKLKEVSKAEAIQLLGANMIYTSVAPAQDIAKGVKKNGVYTATAAGSLTFKLSGSGDADLYIKKNGDVSETVADCASTGSTSSEECKVTVAAGDKISWLILGYADKSNAALSVGTVGQNASYKYNATASRFFSVEMDLHYISEASPARVSHVDTASQYTSTDHYSYILEADANGKIMGGEWVGASRSLHPDFMWWPNGKPQGAVAGGNITYAELKALNDEAAGTTSGGGGTGGQVETKELMKDLVVSGLSQYATVGVPGGAKLTVTMSGTGNADLYVKLGSKPTTSSFTCKSTGTASAETCTVTAPAAGGTYYVRARPMVATSTVTVVATITP